MRLTPLALFAACVLLLPWLAFLLFGFYALWQAGWFYYGMALLSGSSLLAYSLLRWKKRKPQRRLVEVIDIAANPNWTAHDQQAWQSLDAVTAEWLQQPAVLTDLAKMLALSNEVIGTVARHYHADSKYPLLEFPLPYLLKLVTLVCEDLQRDVLDRIPGSHAIRLVDFLRARQTAVTLARLRDYLTVGHWLFNWPGAALAKARGVLFDKGVDTVTQEISQRLLRAYIQKLGYYAIQLYSGQILLDDWLPGERQVAYSKADIAKAAASVAPEPLRLLVLGQVSSGKSSLLNAMFGELKSAVGYLPTTASITPYLLERDGLQQAIILDSAGYGGLAHPGALAELEREWARTDVVLMVCKATQAARAADAEQLAAIRVYFQTERRDQALPVIIAVVTHIDQLRPLQQWQPPYNIQQPDSPKASNIRHSCERVADELQLPLHMTVPVCLAPGLPPYNIDDALLPLIHEQLDAAHRVRYLRCLRGQQAAENWQQWRSQMQKLGQVILARDQV
jgi:predicted GTPase